MQSNNPIFELQVPYTLKFPDLSQSLNKLAPTVIGLCRHVIILDLTVEHKPESTTKLVRLYLSILRHFLNNPCQRERETQYRLVTIDYHLVPVTE